MLLVVKAAAVVRILDRTDLLEDDTCCSLLLKEE